MSTVTLELADDVIEAVHRQAQMVGKDFTQHLQEHITTFYSETKRVPDYLDRTRFRTASEFFTDLGKECGFPDDWQTNTPEMTEEDEIAIEGAFLRFYGSEAK